MGALAKMMELLSKCCSMLLSTWLRGDSFETGVATAAAATSQAALLNTGDLIGTLGRLSWWGVKGWLPRGLTQSLGRGTSWGMALALGQTEPRLYRGS